MRLLFVNTDPLLHPATGVKRGFRDACVTPAERLADAAANASCKEGWDGGDPKVDASFATTPPSRPSPTERGKEVQLPDIAAFLIKSLTDCNTTLATQPERPFHRRLRNVS